jgi:hypothetical protein
MYTLDRDKTCTFLRIFVHKLDDTIQSVDVIIESNYSTKLRDFTFCTFGFCSDGFD